MMRNFLFSILFSLPLYLGAENSLRWKNGDVLRGSIFAATPSTITWKSPSLEEPVILKRSVLQDYFSEKVSEPDNSTHLVETKDGSRIFGKVTSTDEKHVVIESPNFESIRLLRARIERVRLMRSDALLWAGPHGTIGWRQPIGDELRGNPRWENEKSAGSLHFPQMAKPADLEVPLPKRFELRFSVEAPTTPEFAIGVYADTSLVKLETWDRTVVARTGKTTFQKVKTISENERSITLRLFWDVEARNGLVCSDSGEILARFNDVKTDIGLDLSNSIRVLGRCPNLELKMLEIWKWDGSEPTGIRDRGGFTFENRGPAMKPSGLPVELTNTGRFYGTMVESKAGVSVFRVGFSDDLFRVKNSLLKQLRFVPGLPKNNSDSNPPRLKIGSESLSGNWIPSGDRRLLWRLEGAENPVALRIDQEKPAKITLPKGKLLPSQDQATLAYLASGEIVSGDFRSFDRETNSFQFPNPWFEEESIDEAFLQGIFFNARPLSADPADPLWKKIGTGKVEASKGKLVLHKDAAFGHPQILWTGRFSFELPNSTTLVPNLKVRLFCDGLDAESKSTVLSFRHYRNNFQVTSVNRTGRSYLSKAFRTQGSGSQRVEMSWTDDALTIQVGEDNLEIPFDAASGKSGYGLIFEPFTRTGSKPVVIENLSTKGEFAVSPVPYISSKALEDVLFVPRSLGDQKPTHALFGKNEDVLRGILEEFEGDRFVMKSGSLSTEIPLERVNGLIRLSVPLPSEPASPGVWFLVQNGARFFLTDPVFGNELITGRSPTLGECQIPRNQISSLSTGQPPENQSADYLAQFQLRKAPEPGEAGTKDTPTGKPAPDFSLPLLGGGEIELSDLRGKVGVLCFWTSWSASSIRRVNELIELVKTFPEGEVVLLAINSGESVSAIQRLVTKEKWDEGIRIAIDADLEVGKSYEARVYPETAIIDRKGNLARLTGIGEVTRRMIEEAMGMEGGEE